MRTPHRIALLLVTAIVTGLAACAGAPTAVSDDRRAGNPSLDVSDDSTTCLSGYNVANGIVTCND